MYHLNWVKAMFNAIWIQLSLTMTPFNIILKYYKSTDLACKEERIKTSTAWKYHKWEADDRAGKEAKFDQFAEYCRVEIHENVTGYFLIVERHITKVSNLHKINWISYNSIAIVSTSSGRIIKESFNVLSSIYAIGVEWLLFCSMPSIWYAC